MARQQIQLPGVTQATPVARQVDTFTQAKLNSPIPKEVLDLSKFSSAIAEWVGRATEERKQRSLAAGEADVELGRVYGSGLIETPETEKSRKSFKELQKQGEILASEDPFYRIGVFSAEGRRVGMTIQDEVLRDSVIQELAQPVDEKGNFQPFADDIDQQFDRRIQPLLNAPALQTIYGQRAAAEIIKDARAAFHLKVSKARDENLQQYYEGEAIGQLTALLETAHDAADSDPQLRTSMVKGFENIRDEMLVKSNVPEPRKVLRAAYQNYISHALDRKVGGPEEALRRLDFVREMSVGRGVSVMTDESPEGIAFRAQLEDAEIRMTAAKDREDDKERQKLAVERQTASLRFEKQISEINAAAANPHQAYQQALEMANNPAAVDPGYRSMFLDEARKQYKALVDPMPLTYEQTNRVNEMLNENTPDAVDAAIDAMLDVDATGKKTLHDIVEKQRTLWQDHQNVQFAHQHLEQVAKNSTAGLSPEAAGLLNDRIAKIGRDMNEEIRRLASSSVGKDKDKLDAEIVKVIDKANTKVQKIQDDRGMEEKSFNQARLLAWGKGQSFSLELQQAYDFGVITDAQLDAYMRENDRNTSADEFISSANQIVGIYAGESNPLIPGAGASPEAKSEALLVADQKTREWLKTERQNYPSLEAAKAGFAGWRKDNIDPAVKKIFEKDRKAEVAQADASATAQNVHTAITKPKIGTTVKQRVLSQYPDAKADFSTRRFVDSWGNTQQVLEVQSRSRQEAAQILKTVQSGEVSKDAARFKDLARTGFMSFQELSSGKVNINETYWSGAIPRRTTVQGELTFSTSDYDVWDTPVATTYAAFDKLLSQENLLIDYAAKAGITGERYQEWKQIMAVKAKAIEGGYK